MAQISGVALARARAGLGCNRCLDASGVPFSSELLAPDRSYPRPYPDFPAMSRITSTSMDTLGSADAVGYPQGFGGVTRISGDAANHRPLFTLSPYTAVRITGQYALDAWVASTDDAELHTTAFVQTRGADPGSTSVSISADNRYWLPAPLRDSASGSFSATWSNTMDRTRNVWGGINVAASGLVTAVPEPETYALMVAGLGMVSMAVRRRREPARQ